MLHANARASTLKTATKVCAFTRLPLSADSRLNFNSNLDENSQFRLSWVKDTVLSI